MNLKINDVYRFWYNEEWRKKIFDVNCCFDGQLIVKQYDDGNLYLEDTYWGSSCGNKIFTLEEALERGELKFLCNLADVEQCNKSDLDYYDDKDLYDLSSQHGCYIKIYKRKNAKKSIVKMEQVIKDKIETTEFEIESKTKQLQRYKNDLTKIQNGDTNIVIW